MLFTDWLNRNYANRNDRFGDFARRVADDNNFPKTDDYKPIRDYVRLNYDSLMFSTLSKAWTNYQRDKRAGVTNDPDFKDVYRDVWSYAWTLMKRCMRYGNVNDRLQAWEDGRDYYINHMVTSCPDFASGLLDLVKDELIRDAERTDFDIADVVGA